MILDFEKMDVTEMKSFHGGEGSTVAHLFQDSANRVMRGALESGASIGLHKHESGSEFVYVLSGHGKVIYDGKEEVLTAGVCHYCPKGHSHHVINDSKEELLFFAVIVQQ